MSSAPPPSASHYLQPHEASNIITDVDRIGEILSAELTGPNLAMVSQRSADGRLAAFFITALLPVGSAVPARVAARADDGNVVVRGTMSAPSEFGAESGDELGDEFGDEFGEDGEDGRETRESDVKCRDTGNSDGDGKNRLSTAPQCAVAPTPRAFPHGTTAASPGKGKGKRPAPNPEEISEYEPHDSSSRTRPSKRIKKSTIPVGKKRVGSLSARAATRPRIGDAQTTRAAAIAGRDGTVPTGQAIEAQTTTAEGSTGRGRQKGRFAGSKNKSKK